VSEAIDSTVLLVKISLQLFSDIKTLADSTVNFM